MPEMSHALDIALQGAWSPQHLAIAKVLALAAIEWDDPTECKGLTYGQWQLWRAQKILEAIEDSQDESDYTDADAEWQASMNADL